MLGVLGALAAGLVGLSAHPSAVATVEVNTPAVDGDGIDRSVQTAVVQFSTQDVFARAAQLSGVSVDDLRSRTQIAAVPTSQVVSVTVSAKTRLEASRQANALTSAAISTSAARVASAVSAANKQATDLITRSRLANAGAEQARVSALGAALAGRQGDLITGSGQLSLLQPAQPTGTTSSAPLLAAMGLLGGALVGLALTILLSTQVGKVSSPQDLRVARPEATVLELDEVGTTLALDATGATTVVVAGVRQSVGELQDVTDEVVDRLTLAGFEVTLIDVVSLRRRAVGPPAPGVIHVLPVTLNHSVVREVRTNPGLVLLVAVRPRRTRLEWLDGYGPLGSRGFLLVSGRATSRS